MTRELKSQTARMMTMRMTLLTFPSHSETPLMTSTSQESMVTTPATTVRTTPASIVARKNRDHLRVPIRTTFATWLTGPTSRPPRLPPPLTWKLRRRGHPLGRKRTARDILLRRPVLEDARTRRERPGWEVCWPSPCCWRQASV